MTNIFSMAAALADKPTAGDLPVEQWHPSHCGEMDLKIIADGTWIHEGTIIGRPEMVRLFSRVLRRDEDGYVLVTPAEKISITVEDVPFVAVDVDVDAGTLIVRTNVGDMVMAGAAHPITVEPNLAGEAVPYVLVRGGLKARFNRAAYYRLVDMAVMNESGMMTIISGGVEFSLGQAND